MALRRGLRTFTTILVRIGFGIVFSFLGFAAISKLIEQCGYWRRKEELEDAEEAARSW